MFFDVNINPKINECLNKRYRKWKHKGIKDYYQTFSVFLDNAGFILMQNYQIWD